jgi:shikimate kinase
MRRSGVVIHLDVPPALLATRTARHRARRPLLAGGDPETTLASLLKQRLPLYREAAHHRVDGSGTVPQVLGRILGLLGGSSGR